MEFSNRVKNMQYSPIRKLVPLADEAKSKGIKVFGFHIGQPDVKTPDSFFEGITQYEEKIVKYTNSEGHPELMEAFYENYKQSGLNLTKKNILITNGGSEALQFAISTICNPGDEILVPEPYYSNYDSFLRMCDVNLVPIETKIEEGYRLPKKEKIKELITDKTKAIMFSNPCNPTGVIMSNEEMEIIKEISLENDIYIISDEVYKQFIYDNQKFTSFLNIKGVEDRVIMIDSISKHYSACGARIGTLCSRNEELIAQALKLCQARLSVSTIEQFATASLLRDINRYMDEIRIEYKKRRDVMCYELSKIEGVKFNKPDSAFYILVELPVDDVNKFSEWLLKEFNYENKTLMFATGPGFYSRKHYENGIKEARFSFCTYNEEQIKEGIGVLKKALEEYKK